MENDRKSMTELEDFLVRVAELLHAYGTPSHRLERVLQKVSTALGLDARFLSTPTSMLASFGSGADERVHLLRIEPGDVDLGKLVEFDEVLEDVEHQRVSIASARARLEEVAAGGSRWPAWLSAMAFGTASAGAAFFLGGGVTEIQASFAVGLMLFLLGRCLPRGPESVGTFEPLAAFLAAFGALALRRTGLAVDHQIVTLGGLIILLPGLTLTTAVQELTTRHLVAGVARIAGAATIFFTLLLGVALAWRLGELVPGASELVTPTPPPGWLGWLAIFASPPAFAILLEARAREVGVILVTCLLGFAAARLGTSGLGSDLGPILGALAVGTTSNIYARIADRPALVPMIPGTLLLVPGSLGYRSLTSFLHHEALSGMEWAFQTGLVAVSLAGGLLAANVLVPPRRVL